MKQEKWSSQFGFVMAAAGSAVGLGNIWKFPYIAGQNGGAVFIIIYVVLLAALGVPLLISEMAIGRSTRSNPIGACRKISKKCGFIGLFGILGAFFILSYYCVMGGLIIRYFLQYLMGGLDTGAEEFYTSVTQSTSEPIIYSVIFTLICAVIVVRGISGGIEKISRIFMPALIILMIILMIRGLTLSGGTEGAKFFLVPQKIDLKELPSITVSAMGQVFFSLSLGMGTLITYGAYLDKSASIPKAAVYIPLIDLAVALLAGLTVLPAVFSYGIEPSAGSGMIFIALPRVFGEISGGVLFGAAFFLLVFFAAVTSAISLIEVIVSYISQRFSLGRGASSAAACTLAAAASIPVSLSFGRLSDIKIFGMNIYDLVNFISDAILMPLGALGICLLCGYLWGKGKAVQEAGIKSRTGRFLYTASVKYTAPIMITVIFLTALFNM